MVKECEENIIQPPLEFRDGYKLVPKPRQFTIEPPLELRDDYTGTGTKSQKTGTISTD